MKILPLIALMCLLANGAAFAQDSKEKEAVRAAFATGIENREPVGSITDYYTPAPGGILYFFSELRNMQDMPVRHIWIKNGNEVYAKDFTVSGARWRVNSSMKAEHFKTGDTVTVEVVCNRTDADGEQYQDTYASVELVVR